MPKRFRLSSPEIESIIEVRKKARSDLHFLCTEILNYTDIEPAVHDPYTKTHDRFLSGSAGTDLITPTGDFLYIPAEETYSVSIDPLVKRNALFLGFRGSVKTTIQTIGGSIQIILNFPHIAGAIYHNTEDNAKIILKEIVDHFCTNPRMMEFFPEFCFSPEDRKKWATMGEFTTPARFHGDTNILPHKKEPTLAALGLGTSQAGRHYQFIKMTDVVEQSNSFTPESRAKVAAGVKMARNLLEDGECFLFLEGTPYHPEDVYCQIIEREWHKKAPEDREWEIVWHPAYHPDTKGQPRTYSPDEMSLPFKKAIQQVTHAPGLYTKPGKRIPVWPTWRNGRRKFDNRTLEAKEREDPYIFACQQLLKPAAAGTAIFPVDKCFHIYPASHIDLKGLKLGTEPIQLKLMSVDTASSTDPKYSNDTAISCAAVTNTMLRVITHGICGLLNDVEIIEAIFEFNQIFRPDVVLIESTQFTQGLKGQIKIEELKRHTELPIEWVTRPRTASKNTRVQGALRSPFSLNRIKFSSDLSDDYLDRAKMEMSGFPTSKHDDLLDSLEMLVTASASSSAYSSERAKLRALMAEEQERMKKEAQDYARWFTGQDFSDDFIEESESIGW